MKKIAMQTPRSSRRRAPDAPHLRLVVENDRARWVEIAITWGDVPLHLAHVTPGGSFDLVTEGSNGSRSFVVPETLGWSSAPLVTWERGSFFVTLPPRGEKRMLRSGKRVRFSEGRLTVEVQLVAEAEAPRPPMLLSRRAQWTLLAVSALLHALLVILIAHPTPFSR